MGGTRKRGFNGDAKEKYSVEKDNLPQHIKENCACMPVLAISRNRKGLRISIASVKQV